MGQRFFAPRGWFFHVEARSRFVPCRVDNCQEWLFRGTTFKSVAFPCFLSDDDRAEIDVNSVICKSISR